MPTFFKKIFHRKPVKKRKGYFLIAISLMFLMLNVPIWVNMLSLEYKIKSEMNRWIKADFASTYGNSIVKGMLTKYGKLGPGYFKFNGVETRENPQNGEPLTVTFNFLGASVIPVPTRYKDVGPEEFDMTQYGFMPVFANCSDAIVDGLCDETKPLKIANQVIEEDPRFMYTVPTLGTGSAGKECIPGELRTDLTYPNTTIPVDPLDDPCQWDKITLGQTIAIPLFVLDEDNPDKVHVFDPDTLILRVRKPCTTFGLEICLGKDRWETVLDSTYIGSVAFNSRNFDYSNRILDIAIVANNHMLPQIEYSRVRLNSAGELVRIARNAENREVTEKRLMLWSGPDESFEQKNFNDEHVNHRTSSINIGTIPFAEIFEDKAKYIFSSSTRTGDVINRFKVDYNTDLASAVSLFDVTNPTICKILIKNCPNPAETSEYGAFLVGYKSQGFVPPYLLVKMINNMFDVKNTTTNQEMLLQGLEIQLLSNKPLGNTRNATYGSTKYLDEYYSMRHNIGALENLDIVKDTGVVFSN